MPREIVDTPSAPGGGSSQVHSQAVKAGGLVFVSGQAPIDPTTGEMVSGTIEEQTRQCLTNVQAILHAAGSSMDKVVQATFILRDADDFAGMNVEWVRWFPSHPPARQGARMPVDFVPVSFAVIAEA